VCVCGGWGGGGGGVGSKIAAKSVACDMYTRGIWWQATCILRSHYVRKARGR